MPYESPNITKLYVNGNDRAMMSQDYRQFANLEQSLDRIKCLMAEGRKILITKETIPYWRPGQLIFTSLCTSSFMTSTPTSIDILTWSSMLYRLTSSGMLPWGLSTGLSHLWRNTESPSTVVHAVIKMKQYVHFLLLLSKTSPKCFNKVIYVQSYY